MHEDKENLIKVVYPHIEYVKQKISEYIENSIKKMANSMGFSFSNWKENAMKELEYIETLKEIQSNLEAELDSFWVFRVIFEEENNQMSNDQGEQE